MAFFFLAGSAIGAVSVFLAWINVAGSGISYSGLGLIINIGKMEEISMDGLCVFVPVLVLILSLISLAYVLYAFKKDYNFAWQIADHTGFYIIAGMMLYFHTTPDDMGIGIGAYLAVFSGCALFGGAIALRLQIFLKRRAPGLLRKRTGRF
jgi:hypothetical protein